MGVVYTSQEYQFVKLLHGKKVGELFPLFRDLIDDLYGKPNEQWVVSAWLNHYPQKATMFVRVHGIIKGIRLKLGMNTSMHIEEIKDFVNFLKECKVNEACISAFLRYHYADGTTDGKGNCLLSFEEYQQLYDQDIVLLNQTFNRKEILKKAMERFVLKGTYSKYSIDAIVYGNVCGFLYLLRHEIEDILIAGGRENSLVHFGNLVCKSKMRSLNYCSHYSKDRHFVQIEWHCLFDDMIQYRYLQAIKN